MKKMLLFSLVLSMPSQASVTQYLCLTAGTPGVGVRYSLLAGPLCAKAGFLLSYQFVSDRTGDVRVTDNKFYGTPNIGVAFFPVRNRNIRGAAEFAVFFPVSYTNTDYDPASVDSTAELSGGFRFDYWLAPGVEFYWFDKDMPRFAVEFALIKITPANVRLVSFEAGCAVTVFIKRMGKDQANLTAVR